MRTIAVVNQKGGCGKTTTAISLAGVFARRGWRTLLVDMDPQSHCAAGLAIPEQRIDMDVGDAMLLEERRKLDASRLLWRASRNLDLIPSRTKLAGLEALRGGLAEAPDREQKLRKLLDRLRGDYDVCLIDCSPSIGLLTFNAMSAADAVLIPVETSFFSLQGATKQVSAVRTMCRRLGKRLPYWLLPTIHEADSPLAKDLLDELRRRYAERVTPICIRRDPALREAASFGQPVIEYSPTSPGATDYAALGEWIGEALAVGAPGVPARAASTTITDAADDDEPVDAVESSEPQDAESAPAPVMSPPAPPVPSALPAPQARASVTSERAAPALPGGFEVKPLPSGDPGLALEEVVLAPVPPDRAADLAARAQRLHERVQSLKAPLTVDRPAPMEDRLARPVNFEAVRRLFGARQVTSGVLFVQPLAIGSKVAIAGDFNGWSDSQHVMRRNEEVGVYELVIPVPSGRYSYRLIIDGVWRPDPYNPAGEPNPFGERNSLLEVR